MTTNISIYPNPAKDNLVLEGAPSALRNFKLYNNIGQDITASAIITEQNQQRVVLDISNLVVGTYLLKTAHVVKKIIKK